MITVWFCLFFNVFVVVVVVAAADDDDVVIGHLPVETVRACPVLTAHSYRNVHAPKFLPLHIASVLVCTSRLRSPSFGQYHVKSCK